MTSDPITGQPFAVGSFVSVIKEPKIYGEVVRCVKESFDEDREWRVYVITAQHTDPVPYWFWQVEECTTDGRLVTPCIHEEIQ